MTSGRSSTRANLLDDIQRYLLIEGQRLKNLAVAESLGDLAFLGRVSCVSTDPWR